MRGWRNAGAVGSLCGALVVGTGACLPALAEAPAAADTAAPPAATSADGRFVLLAQAVPPCLVVLDAARGTPVHAIVPASREGRVATRIAALRTAPLRRSFVVAPADLPELWEISYDPKAEDIYDGLVHDYHFGEGVPRRGFLGLKRTPLPEPIADFAFDEHEAEAWGLAASPPAGSGEGLVINLDVRRRVAGIPGPEMARRIDRAQASARAAADALKPQPAADLAQRRTASRSWPCTAPKVPGP